MFTRWIHWTRLLAVVGVLCVGLVGIAIPAAQASATRASASTASGVCIQGAKTCESTTPRFGRSTTITSDKVTLTTSGRGTVILGTYRRNPAGVLSSSTGKFFGISVTAGNKFATLVVKDCNLGGGTSFVWWNGHAWANLLSQGGTTYTTCFTFTLGSTSTPSLASLTKLSRLSRFGAVVFAVAGYPSST